MAWFADLTPYSYVSLDSLHHPPAPSPLNVGWLARDEPFPVGEVPREFVERLGVLVEHAATRVLRGLHFCDLCPGDPDGDLGGRASGCAEIRAVGEDGTRYAAPVLIHHYVAEHRYRPPPAFVAAVLRTAHLSPSLAYRADLCLSCAAPVERVSCHEARDFASDAPILVIEVACHTCDVTYHRSLPDPGRATR